MWSTKIITPLIRVNGILKHHSKRVQTVNPPEIEVGPGTVATWGTDVTDEVNVPEFRYEWKRNGRSSRHIAFNLDGSIEALDSAPIL